SGTIDYESAFYQTEDSCQSCLTGGIALPKNLVRVYPTLIDTYLNIEVPEKFINASYSLINCMGQIVFFNKIVEKQTTVALHDVPAGVYILSLSGDIKLYFRVLKK
ncbi:MAG: T9SS type A sorting domain-containing protein, partial [Bacteroidetes bacterium]|nr:T9SS type A sorting domain-containing protein [Bacteroidota bacterium]